MVDSTRRYVARYSWPSGSESRDRLYAAEYRRGPVPVPVLGIALTFEQIYAATDVPAILHPIEPEDRNPSEVRLDRPGVRESTVALGVNEACGALGSGKQPV